MKFIASGRFGRCFAVTLPSKHIVVTKLINVQSKKQRKLVRREVYIHARAQHDSICQFFKAFWTQNNVFIVLEYCNGGTLWDVAKTGAYRHAWTVQLLQGVVYLHENRILHRDLKLSNILLKNQRVKISDFGFATKGPTAHGMYGTPNYLAPEILNHEPYSYGVDVWAVGCCLYAVRHYGQGPFQRQSTEETYTAIKAFDRPSTLQTLEAAIFVADDQRPSAAKLLCTLFALQPADDTVEQNCHSPPCEILQRT
jgi:polo-like kinase 1